MLSADLYAEVTVYKDELMILVWQKAKITTVLSKNATINQHLIPFQHYYHPVSTLIKSWMSAKKLILSPSTKKENIYFPP